MTSQLVFEDTMKDCGYVPQGQVAMCADFQMKMVDMNRLLQREV